MGMDLITTAWTQENGKTDADAVRAIIASLTDDEITSQTEVLDPSGRLGFSDFPDDEAEELRAWISNGADVYLNVDELRLHDCYPLPDTGLWFYVVGGGSWGDDPFDGFTDLTTFIEACSIWPELAEAAGFVCGGLPKADYYFAKYRESGA
jgi:hypothetical protein